MKKYFCCIISMLLIFSLMGCKSSKVRKDTSKDNFDINKAINVSKEYLNNIIEGNPSKNKELLSKEASDDEKNVDIKSDLLITNYDVYEYNELGKSTTVKVYTSRNRLDNPYASVDDISIKVIKEEDEYKIDKVVNSTDKEVFVYGTGINYRNKDDIKTKIVLKTKNLPEYIFNKSLSANSVKVPVERNAFENLTLSISGETLAVSTYNKDSFIFLVNIKQTQETATGQDNKSSKQEGGASDTENDAEKEEKYIGNNIKEAGILKDKKVEMMAFSPDGKYLAVQYTSSNENSIAVYDVKNSEEVYLGLDKKFKSDKVNISILNVEKSSVNIKAFKKDNVSDEEAKDMTGKFTVSFEKYQIEEK